MIGEYRGEFLYLDFGKKTCKTVFIPKEILAECSGGGGWRQGLRIEITMVGALTHSLPGGREVIEGQDFTVQEVLSELVNKHGPALAGELFEDGQMKQGLALLVNGRNVLSLPDKFQTPLKDGDEMLITIFVAGG